MPSKTAKKTDINQLCINTIRFLSVDAVEKAKSGHPGTPMALAPIAYHLYTNVLKHNPKNPDWPNRDRFVLSAGHASMLLYSILHLTGYDLSLEDLKNFRQWGSATPGHPEHGDTPGVETTTGPLGQGIATAVGMAIAQRYLNGILSPKGKALLDYKIYGIASDGDIMEGISAEGASLAGHLGLSSMIFFYDDNRISIEGDTAVAFTEDVAARYKAYNWNVLRVKDGNNLDEIAKAVKTAQKEKKRPTLIITRTHIGYGSPNKQDTGEAHGAPLGPEETILTKKNLGWPLEPTFHIPPEVLPVFQKCVTSGAKAEESWNQKLAAWKKSNPTGAKLWDRLSEGKLPEGWEKAIPEFAAEEKIATRAASGKVLTALAPILPELLGGSADLSPSNNTFIKGAPSFSRTISGRNFHFGIREHAMAAAMNGMALSNMLIPYGGTFLIFSDYMKGAMRISALNHKRVVYVLTHDSIGLGEDGPTHQPIEQIAHLRATPNTIVIRPADALETAAAWKFAIEHKIGPVVLALSRQNLPTLSKTKYPNAGLVDRGAYILSEGSATPLQMILIATGSEVSLALEAKSKLESEGISTRVVSMPSWELFEKQPTGYKETVLPRSIKKRIAIEALSSFGWERYTGSEGDIVGMTTFGKSAPGNIAMEKFGFTVANVVERAKSVLNR